MEEPKLKEMIVSGCEISFGSFVELISSLSPLSIFDLMKMMNYNHGWIKPIILVPEKPSSEKLLIAIMKVLEILRLRLMASLREKLMERLENIQDLSMLDAIQRKLPWDLQLNLWKSMFIRMILML